MVERIDDFLFDIDENIFKITTDAIALVDFILKDDISQTNILEIGFGSGYISTKLYKYTKKITAIDIQQKVYEKFKQNLENNNININCLNVDLIDYNNKHDIIVTNPPYYPENSGKYPENEIKKISKFEIKLNLDILLKKINELLKNDKSVFYLVYPINRKNDMINKLKYYNLEILSLEEKGKIFLLKGKKLF